MELRVFLSALRKFWWVIALVTVLGGAGGAAYAYQKTPLYASTVTFFAITPTPATGSPYAADQFAQQRVTSYVDLLSSDRLAKLVLTDQSIDRTIDQVRASIDGAAKPATVLLTATITDSDLNRSLAIAVDVSREFPKLVQDIESDGGTKEALVGLTVVNGPSALPTPISPRTKLLIALGLVIGLVLGLAVALLREVFDTTVRSVERLRGLTGVPVLGVITVDAAAKKAPLIVESGARSLMAESFRQLRTNLQFVNVEEPAAVIVVTSSVAGEGKSTSAANLAIAFAEAGSRVLLADADLRRPKIAGLLGIEGSVGLTNVLAGQVDVSDVIQPWGAQGLEVLVSGSIPPNPSELLGSRQMDDLIMLLRDRFDIVIVDTPPLLPVTDAAVAARHADGAVVIVRHGKTRRAAVQRSLETLRAVDARVLGTVLNLSPAKGADAQNSYGRDGYAPLESGAKKSLAVSSRSGRNATSVIDPRIDSAEADAPTESVRPVDTAIHQSAAADLEPDESSDPRPDELPDPEPDVQSDPESESVSEDETPAGTDPVSDAGLVPAVAMGDQDRSRGGSSPLKVDDDRTAHDRPGASRTTAEGSAARRSGRPKVKTRYRRRPS